MKYLKPPKRLRQRPQHKGLPVPYITMILDDGKPDFRVTDEKKRISVIANGWCQLCGEPLGKAFFFTGGIDAAKANLYFEPASHLDCLTYAMQVCPFIVGRINHADTNKLKSQYDNSGINIIEDDVFAAKRNPWWVIKKADRWRHTFSPGGTLLLEPHEILTTNRLHPETMTAADWHAVFSALL